MVTYLPVTCDTYYRNKVQRDILEAPLFTPRSFGCFIPPLKLL